MPSASADARSAIGLAILRARLVAWLTCAMPTGALLHRPILNPSLFQDTILMSFFTLAMHRFTSDIPRLPLRSMAHACVKKAMRYTTSDSRPVPW